MKKEKKHTNKELAEAHVYPTELSAIEKRKAEKEFSDFVGHRRDHMTEEDRYYSRLLQLKYMMEDYINDSVYKKNYTFGYFLNEYIHSIHKSKTEFAKEIGLHLTQVSRLLNNRDIPNDRILVRLETHSNNLIPDIYWYRITEKQKEWGFIMNKTLRKTERKKVKNNLFQVSHRAQAGSRQD